MKYTQKQAYNWQARTTQYVDYKADKGNGIVIVKKVGGDSSYKFTGFREPPINLLELNKKFNKCVLVDSINPIP